MVKHYLLEGGEEAVGEGFFAGADGGNWLGGKLLWSIVADVRVMFSIAHLVLVLKFLDLSMEALVLLQLLINIQYLQEMVRGKLMHLLFIALEKIKMVIYG